MERFGNRPQTAELQDMTDLLGHEVTDLELGRSELQEAVMSGRVSIEDVVRYEWNRVCWNHTLVGGAMGVLATRHLPRVQG